MRLKLHHPTAELARKALSRAGYVLAHTPTSIDKWYHAEYDDFRAIQKHDEDDWEIVGYPFTLEEMEIRRKQGWITLDFSNLE